MNNIISFIRNNVYVVGLVVSLVFVASIVSAFTPPTQAPPEGNTAGPVTPGSTQTITGLKTFNVAGLFPFAIDASNANTVANLDSDKVDAYDAADLLAAEGQVGSSLAQQQLPFAYPRACNARTTNMTFLWHAGLTSPASYEVNYGIATTNSGAFRDEEGFCNASDTIQATVYKKFWVSSATIQYSENYSGNAVADAHSICASEFPGSIFVDQQNPGPAGTTFRADREAWTKFGDVSCRDTYEAWFGVTATSPSGDGSIWLLSEGCDRSHTYPVMCVYPDNNSYLNALDL